MAVIIPIEVKESTENTKADCDQSDHDDIACYFDHDQRWPPNESS
jgi:hypothetical protein